jgi:hypothetical protein
LFMGSLYCILFFLSSVGKMNFHSKGEDGAPDRNRTWIEFIRVISRI